MQAYVKWLKPIVKLKRIVSTEKVVLNTYFMPCDQLKTIRIRKKQNLNVLKATKTFTVVLLHDDGLHVDDDDVGAFFQPEIAPIYQILEPLVTVILPLRNEILDSCKRKLLA